MMFNIEVVFIFELRVFYAQLLSINEIDARAVLWFRNFGNISM